MFGTVLALISLIALCRPAPLVNSIGNGRPAGFGKRQSSIQGPVIADNFPDPAIISVDGGYYAFSTSSAGLHVPSAKTTVDGRWAVSDVDALPSPGVWSTERDIWAPDVVRLDDGTFVMYYSTWLKSDPEIHCIGAAKSKTVGGPYEPELQPLACPIDQGGAIDPSGYQDPATGLRYVVYKVDGNYNGNGGSCGNTVKPVVPTPILLQQVGSDGVSPIGAPVPILDRDDSDGPLVEAPSLYRTAEGTYFLFFSSGCYTDTSYDEKYATAPTITGPYTKASAPLLKSGDGPKLNGPGGATMAADGQVMVFHANLNPPGQPLKRAMFTAKPTFSGTTVTI